MSEEFKIEVARMKRKKHQARRMATFKRKNQSKGEQKSLE